MTGLIDRGWQVGFFHIDAATASDFPPRLANIDRFSLATDGPDALERACRWRPDLCFSHNMEPLDVEAELIRSFPVVKFMHAFSGTCISQLKMHRWPWPTPCERTFGPPCLALYFPRRCGPISIGAVTAGYAHAKRQQELFPRYRAMVVASEAMRAEFVRNSMPADRVHVEPLFPSASADETGGRTLPETPTVLFAGRMTFLKGGDFLIRAVAMAQSRLGRPIRLIMAGAGPQRSAWQSLVRNLGVDGDFPGWLNADSRDDAARRSSLVAMPSVWPEPYGLVGPECGRIGLPAIAFDVGGVREWLKDGETGWLVTARPPSVRALADGLICALRDPAELIRRGENARLASRDASLARHLDGLEKIFRQVVA